MEIKINGYVVKNVTDNTLNGIGLDGHSWNYHLKENNRYTNNRIHPKVYFDIRGAEKAIKYQKDEVLNTDEYKIIPVEVIYNIKEDEVE